VGASRDPPAGVIVKGLFYEETVTSWPGEGGSYKTFTLVALGCCVAAGRDFGRLKVPKKYYRALLDDV
jgi:hypothetical protein